MSLVIYQFPFFITDKLFLLSKLFQPIPLIVQMDPLKLKQTHSLPYPHQHSNQNKRQFHQPLSPLSKFSTKHDKDLMAARRRHSLAPETVPIPKSPSSHFLTRNRHSFIFSSSGNAGNSQIVAIDSKIEQAMVCFFCF